MVAFASANRCEAVAVFNPKGIASISPRLARQRLPWVNVANGNNRNAVAAIPVSFGARVKTATTPLGL